MNYHIGQVLYRAGFNCVEEVYYQEWEVVGLTEKGAWIRTRCGSMLYGKKRIVYKGRIRRAYPTKEEALNSLIVRVKRYMERSCADVRRAKMRCEELGLVNAIRDFDEWLSQFGSAGEEMDR
jgi:hypothetical protein